jgi:hypothetical protein
MNAMKRIPKLWTGLGVAAIAGSMAAQADVITLKSAPQTSRPSSSPRRLAKAVQAAAKVATV